MTGVCYSQKGFMMSPSWYRSSILARGGRMFWNVMPFFCLAVVIHSIRAHAAVESDSVICAKSIIALPTTSPKCGGCRRAIFGGGFHIDGGGGFGLFISQAIWQWRRLIAKVHRRGHPQTAATNGSAFAICAGVPSATISPCHISININPQCQKIDFATSCVTITEGA